MTLSSLEGCFKNQTQGTSITRLSTLETSQTLSTTKSSNLETLSTTKPSNLESVSTKKPSTLDAVTNPQSAKLTATETMIISIVIGFGCTALILFVSWRLIIYYQMKKKQKQEPLSSFALQFKEQNITTTFNNQSINLGHVMQNTNESVSQNINTSVVTPSNLLKPENVVPKKEREITTIITKEIVNPHFTTVTATLAQDSKVLSVPVCDI